MTRARRFLSLLVSFAMVGSLLVLPAGVASAVITDWTTRNSGGTSILNGVAFGDNQWIAVGASGTITRSTDNGDIWSKMNSGSSTLYDVWYADGAVLWLAVGNSGKILTSPDGNTWTPQTNITPSIGTTSLRSVISDGTDIVAVGAAGKFLHSTDGIVWTSTTAGTAGLWNLAYGGGAFIAIGDAGAIWRSVDGGMSWTDVKPAGLTANLLGVGYGNGMFVVTGPAGLLLTSADGTAWTTATHGSADWYGAEYGGDKWVVVGAGGAIHSTPDFASWTAETSNTASNLYTLHFANTKFVAAGTSGVITTQATLSNNNFLSGLTISSGTLSPAFARGTTSGYTASVPYTVAAIDVVATEEDAMASASINGGTASETVTLNVGANTISVVVTAEDGSTKTYTMTVTRAAPSNNASLSNLTISAGTLTPAFATGTLSYTATVANAVTSLDVTPTTADATATVTVAGLPADSGVAENVPLDVGANAIPVVVTAQDGTTEKTYTITVTRRSNNADLAALGLSTGTLSPAFDAATTSYTASVANNVTSIDVTPTAADSTATLKVNGATSASGTPVAVPVTVGNNTVTVRVTAEDGNIKTYTVVVTRLSNNANLSGLVLSTGTLSPAFATGTTSYTAGVAHGVTTLNVTATVAEATATLTVNGSAATSGAPAAVPISTTSPTTINVEVTAQDGTPRTYSVVIWPAPAFSPAAANSSQLVSVGGGLTSLEADAVTGSSLTFSRTAGALPAGVTLNADGTFSGTVTTVGSTSATIRVANDKGGSATTTLAVTVQAAPAFTAAASNTSQLISGGAKPSALQATKASGETLTFSVIGGALPDGITLNADGTFDAAASALGTFTATIAADDTHGGRATTSLAVTVQEAPAFTAAASNTVQLVSVGGALQDLLVTKAAGETLTFSLVGGALPAGITLNADGTFTGIVTTVGATSADIQAADTHGGRETTTLAVTVQAAPAYTAAATNTAQLVSVGAGLTSLDVTAAAGETLTFSVTGGALPDGVALNADGTFSGNVTTTGVTTATIRAADTHGGRASTTLEVTVQEAPAFTAAPDNTSQMISTGVGLTALAATKAAGETLTFSLAGGALPDGITLNANGTFTGTATTAETVTATIEAADTHGGRASTTLTVAVQPAPAYTAAETNTAQTASVGSELAALQATKAPGETLTFSVTGGALPAGITMNADGSFTGTVTTIGTTTATIRVADTHGGLDTTTLAVTVQAKPAFTAAAANMTQLVSVGAGLTALAATKATGETLTFSVTGGDLPAGISLNADGTFSGAATATEGTTATIQAADTHGGLASTTLQVTVQVAPVFTAAPANTAQLVSVGAGLAPLAATKADGETLTYSVAGGSLPDGITLNAATGSFSGTATTVGTTTATILAADTHGGVATTDLTVHAQAAPAFTADASNTSQLVSRGAGLTALAATKAVGETLTFAITVGGLPASISLNADGTFSGTATALGATSAVIEVTDTHGGSATTTLAVTVQVEPAFTGAAANTAQLISTTGGLDPLAATAATGETLTFTVVGGALPAGITLNADGTFAGTATTVGPATADIEAADTHGGTDTTTLVVTVQPGPAFTGAATNTVQTASRGSGLTALAATKADGETLTFALTGGSLPAGITLNSATGAFSGTVTTVGDTTATIRVTDTHGGWAITTLEVTVQAKPSFTAAAANTTQLVSAGAGLAPLEATAATGETLTFTLSSGALPEGITLGADGTFAGTASTLGTAGAVIEVADTHGGVAYTNLTVTVQQAPAFTAAAANTTQLTSAGAGLAALTATAAIGETLTFTEAGGALPAGITLNTNGTFSGTATTPETATVTIVVADTHGGTATTVLTVTVQAAPAFTAAAANTTQLVSVGAGLTALAATMADGETLTFTRTGGSLPAGITLDSATGAFTGTVTTVDDTTATIRVTDTHGGAATTILTVAVQAAPAFTGAAANTTQLISTSAGLTALAATKADGETLTFAVESGSLPAGITLNGDGTFSGSATTVETTSATIRATDTHGGRATTDLAVTVQPGPAFTAAAANTAQLVSVGAGLTELAATKADFETLTYTVAGGSPPAGITLNANGTFSGTATTVETATVTIAAADTHGGVATTDLTVTVQAAPAFTAAVANTLQLVSLGAELTDLAATKADGETLTFTVAAGALPAGITLNSNGTFTGTVTTVGVVTFTVQAADTHGGLDETDLTVTVQAAPAFTAAAANTTQLVSAGVGLAPLVATAAAGETLTFSLTDGLLPAGISLNPNGSFTGTATSVGITTATIRAADTHGGAAETDLEVTVQAAPAFTGAQGNTAQLVSVGAGLTALDATVAAGETKTLAVIAGTLPDGVTLNTATGAFSGTVTTVGETTATIQLADTHGGVTTTDLKVTVQAAPAFTGAPGNTAQLISTGAELAALQTTKATGETLTFTLAAGDLPAGVELENDGSFSGTATTVGLTSATIEASDTHGGKATTVLNVTVQAAPAFTAAPANTAQLVSTGSGLAALEATKATGETLTFTVKSGALPAGISLNTNGSFTGAATTVGATTADIEAADNHGGKATTSLAVTVQPAPAFTDAPGNTAQLISVGAGLTALAATKADGETLTFSVDSGSPPAGISLNGDGTFSSTATTVGASSATIRVRDTHGGTTTTVLAATVQTAPAFTAAETNTAQLRSVGAGLLPLAATAAAGDTLSFSLAGPSLPAGITLSTNGTFSGTTTALGETTASIEAADTHGGKAYTALKVTVQAAPAFTAAPGNTGQLVSAGVGLTNLETTAAAGETLSFAVTAGQLPPGITLSTGGAFSGLTTTVGTTSATIQVTDTHGGVATTELEVTVQVAPDFTDAPANTAQLRSIGAGLIALQVTAAAGETLTFTRTGGTLPTGITVHADGTFTGTVTTEGDTEATIQVSDTHGGVTSTVLDVTVQRAPAFTDAGTNTSQLVSAGSGLTALHADAAAGESLTYAVTGGLLPEGITLNADGSFSGTATTEATSVATVQVADTHGGRASTLLTVTVQEAPAFTAATSNREQLVSVGAGLTALQATAAPGEALTFTQTGGSLPAGITMGADGTFSGAVTTTGATSAAIQVADNHGGRATTTLAVTVQQAPAFTGAAANTAQVTSTGAGMTALQTTSAAGETLTFSLESGTLPAGITLNADGTFSGTATTAGSATAQIRVADTHGGQATTTLVITVQQGPVFTSATSNVRQAIETGDTPTRLLVTADAGQTVTFALVSGTLPAGVTLNPDGTFAGRATRGTYTATIEVLDTRGGRATTTLTVTVSTPTPTPVPSISIDGGTFTTATPEISGSAANLTDGTTVTVTVGGHSYTTSLDGGTWSVSVTHALNVGEHTVRASAGSASDEAEITIKLPPELEAIADQTNKVGDRVSLAVNATAPAGGELAYSATGLTVGLEIDAATGLITGNTTKEDTYQVTVTVTETVAGGTASRSFTWLVLKPQAGAVSGLVTDAVTGKPVSGATVNLRQLGSRDSVTTGAAGTYSFVSVSSLHTFTLTVSHGSYLSDSTGELSIKPGEAIVRDFRLTPAGALRITSPAERALVRTPPAVTGTLTGAGTATVSLQVNGQPAGTATPGADGAWQVTVDAGLLEVGPNTLGATAVTSTGATLQAQPVTFIYSPHGNLRGTVRMDTGVPAAGIQVQLLDLSGKAAGSESAGADGSYGFTGIPAGTYTVRAGTASEQITVEAGKEIRQDLLISARIRLGVSVDPASMPGDGRSAGTVTVTATTADGKPAADVAVRLSATAGTLSDSSLVTGDDGTAEATLKAPMLEGIKVVRGTVTARVEEKARGINAAASAAVQFVPASITGVVIDNRTSEPVAGARVAVAEDFNLDGVVDFAAETTTGADGKYTIYVPRGNWAYKTQITMPVQVGDQTVTMTTIQESKVGQVTAAGQAFSAERAIVGQLLLATAPGQAPQRPDQALTRGETITATLRRNDTGETVPLTVSPQGSYAVGDLNPGEYRLVFRITAPDGQVLAGTSVKATVAASGELNLQLLLIDPYGTVTDRSTGHPIVGAKMTLMWADTALNRSKGRQPETSVTLPVLPDFAPNENRMPQLTTAEGKYAWMVFPDGDYYIVAEKDGYQTYDSRREGRTVAAKAGEDSYVSGGVIHVGETIVLYDLQMSSSAQHTRYIKGYPDGTFGPERQITRAEVATVLSQLVLEMPVKGDAPAFTDVGGEHWAARYIAAVASRGIMVGDPDGRFRPDAPVSRAEVAVIVSRLKQLGEGTATFEDVAGHWAAPYIGAAKNAGIVGGYPDGTYRPEQSTTRAEFVTIINRTLGRGPLAGVTAPTFPDVPLEHWASGQVEEAASDHFFELRSDGKEYLVK